jgi:hypothetical protein
MKTEHMPLVMQHYGLPRVVNPATCCAPNANALLKEAAELNVFVAVRAIYTKPRTVFLRTAIQSAAGYTGERRRCSARLLRLADEKVDVKHTCAHHPSLLSSTTNSSPTAPVEVSIMAC